MSTHILLLILGGTFIYLGAEGLVWGGSHLARRFHVSPIVIGLSVVAFGTSLPEFTVSIYSVFTDSNDIAIGNITGSNIANIALILATSALIFPIKVRYEDIRKDLYVVIAITIGFMVLAFDGLLSRIDGIILVIAMAAYLYRLFNSSKVVSEISESQRTQGQEIGALVIGLGILVWGTNLFTNSAIYIAKTFEVPELVIGATIVAIGTSLPKLATSLVAAFRKQSGIVLGNILGSNVFNLLAVMGVIPILKPVAVAQQAIEIQLPLIFGLTIILVPILKFQQGMNRVMGFLLLLIYIGFTLFVYSNGTASV